MSISTLVRKINFNMIVYRVKINKSQIKKLTKLECRLKTEFSNSFRYVENIKCLNL